MFKDYLELFLNAEFINGNKKKKLLLKKVKERVMISLYFLKD